jgi:hypothetical protein
MELYSLSHQRVHSLVGYKGHGQLNLVHFVAVCNVYTFHTSNYTDVPLLTQKHFA